MRLIDRLQEYLEFSQISAYAFEHSCGVSNGYLGKQLRGKGAVGSDILERIKESYPELSLVWLVSGRGKMLLSPPVNIHERYTAELKEEEQIYFTSKDEVIKLLQKQIEKLILRCIHVCSISLFHGTPAYAYALPTRATR